MQRREPLKAIVASTVDVWDRPEVRPAVRDNFRKLLKCGTGELGAEVFASDAGYKVVPHTCKSRACTSCGHRATIKWQRSMWASLPDVPFTGIVFTMPCELWHIFRDNRHLLHDLPALGAAVLQQWSMDTCGAKLMILVIPHTFGRHVNFNPHLHILASAAGMNVRSGHWVPAVRFERSALMKRCRYALITYLREAWRAGLVASDLGHSSALALFTAQYERWWNVHVHPCTSKEHFLKYAGRYARRPPIAQYRFLDSAPNEVSFRTKDHKLNREVLSTYDQAEFVRTLANHVPDRYKHGVRHFGLLAPRTKHHLNGTVFAALSQSPRPRPIPLGWALSIEREFGRNPLIDVEGKRMRWIGRRSASSVPA